MNYDKRLDGRFLSDIPYGRCLNHRMLSTDLQGSTAKVKPSNILPSEVIMLLGSTMNMPKAPL